MRRRKLPSSTFDKIEDHSNGKEDERTKQDQRIEHRSIQYGSPKRDRKAYSGRET